MVCRDDFREDICLDHLNLPCACCEQNAEESIGPIMEK
jgi:hypothetical protein